MAGTSKKVGVLGAGKIGGSLIERLSASDGFDLTVSDIHTEQLERFAKGYGVATTSSNREAAEAAGILVVAVKPWDVGAVLDEVAPTFEGTDKAIVSVAAGVPIAAIAKRLPEGAAVLRVMPNVCAAVGLGSAVVAANEPGGAYLSAVMDIFRHVGDVMELPERLFDAATALHGSGPAYVALFADALTQAGVREGIPRDVARRLVNQTIGGTSVLLKERAAHQIRDEVMTPGGTTAAAFVAMEKAGFVAAVYDGIEAATEQARRLAEVVALLQSFGFSVSNLLATFVQYAYYILFGAILLSILVNYLSLFLPASGFTMALYGPVRAVADPILMPLRRLIPPLRLGSFALDLSPIIAIILLSVARTLLLTIIDNFVRPVTG